MKINLNDLVFIQLTDFGRKILKDQHNDFYKSLGLDRPYLEPQEDSEGWSKWQLWDIMHRFGNYMSVGFHEVPFKLTIKIGEE